MEHGLGVRRAVLQDVDRILEVWVEAMDFHRSLDPMFERCADAESMFAAHVGGMIGDDERVVLVAEADGGVVGFANGSIAQGPPVLAHRDHGFIDNLHVRETHQRRGLGTALLEGLMDWFRAQGVPTVQARFLLANPKMTAFLKSTAFEPVLGILRGPVSGRRTP